MSVWYRAHRSARVDEVFSGNGGLFTAGRWNHAGTKAIYCSQSIALCTLEWLAAHGLSVASFSYFRYSIEIPDDLIVKLSLSQLPSVAGMPCQQWN